MFVSLYENLIRRSDDRGYLDILYEQGDVVLKRSFSKAGVFRGMHWQRPPHIQTKLIRVVSGRIMDFLFEPESTSNTLSYRSMTPADGWFEIGAHLAHGFYAHEDTEFEYLCHGAYNESAEVSYSIVDYLRGELGLTTLILSAKDFAAKPLPTTKGYSLHRSMKMP